MWQYYAESWPVMLNAVATAMETRDPYILGAMEGMDDVAAASSTKRNAESEPTAMFFIIFGLVYEALSSSTPYSESSTAASGNMPLIALRAMKCLVRREYSGKAFLEPTIFDELLNLWYRIAMTEPPVLQTQLMEVICVFAIEQGRESNPFVALFPPMGTHMLTVVTVRMTLHRQRWFVCVYVHIYLRMPFLVPKDLPVVRFPRRISVAKILDTCQTDNQSNPADRITLIKTSFNALLAIGSSFDAKIQDEVRAVAISLYSGTCDDPTHLPFCSEK
jgi:HEAT repeat-containing protein 5